MEGRESPRRKKNQTAFTWSRKTLKGTGERKKPIKAVNIKLGGRCSRQENDPDFNHPFTRMLIIVVCIGFCEHIHCINRCRRDPTHLYQQ